MAITTAQTTRTELPISIARASTMGPPMPLFLELVPIPWGLLSVAGTTGERLQEKVHGVVVLSSSDRMS